ncbi:MAG: hypothetical protein ACRC8A_03480 [Microcoleaceae cyanobacterium]
MSSTSQPRSSILSAQNLVIFGMIWAVASLLFFLLFSVTPDGEELPLWYSVGTYIFELGAFFMAFMVCYRNWQSPQMVSGRSVWLGIGLGALCYFLGGVVFGVWELIWGLDPAVSPADIFYILSYLFLGWGIVSAIVSKRLNLQLWQWAALTGVAIAGTALAIWVADPSVFGLLSDPSSSPESAEIVQVQPDSGIPQSVDQSPAPNLETPGLSSDSLAEDEETSAPAWVLALDKKLEPYAFGVNLFYIIGDVFLLIFATALILAFWGGRFSQSWRMIAFAAFSLYVADMYYKWADTRASEDYESGGLLEVFFVFTGILLAVGAILEYDISTRSRQSRRSRRSSTKS